MLEKKNERQKFRFGAQNHNSKSPKSSKTMNYIISTDENINKVFDLRNAVLIERIYAAAKVLWPLHEASGRSFCAIGDHFFSYGDGPQHLIHHLFLRCLSF